MVPLININSPANTTLNTSTPRLNLTLTENNLDSVWNSLDGGITNITYAHKNGTIDFGFLDLVFADDFDNYPDNATGSPRWINLPSFGRAIMENKTYKLYNETPLDDALSYINNSYFQAVDYSGSAKAMVPIGYNGSAYLTPRFAGVDWKYEIALDYQFSSININKVVNNVWSQLVARWTGELGVFVSRGEWHTIGFEVNSNNISASVDNVKMLSVLDSSLNNATFDGFSLISLDDVNAHLAYFDNLEIHRKLSYGNHTLTVYANDTFGNVNLTNVTFFVNVTEEDMAFPLFSDFAESPANGTAYSSGASYFFNSTVTPTNGTAGVEFNGINYSASNLSSVFNSSILDLAAGTYSYYWWAFGNGTSNNFNNSGIRYYTIAKASQAITPLLNGASANLAITYPQQVNASFTGTNQTDITIKINSTTVSRGINYTWGAGGWVVNYSASSNQNYSEFGAYLNLTIDRASSSCSISSNSPVAYPAQINVTGSCDNPEVSFALFRNGVDVTNENGALVVLGAGSYNYTSNVSSSQNYTNANASLNVVVNQASSEVNLTLNGSEGNLTIIQGSSVLLNGTLITGEASGRILLYNNGTLINNATNEASNLTTFNNAGLFNVTVIYAGSQNYSQSSETYYLNVTNSLPSVVLNSPENNSNFSSSSVLLNFSVYELDLNNISAWVYGDGVVRNVSHNLTNGSSVVYNWTNLGNGNHNWSVVVSDGFDNSTSDVFLFNVNKSGAAPVVRIYYPSYASTYRENNSLSLNFSASSDDLDKCWYSYDGGLINTTINNCANTTLSLANEGFYNLSLYANESILGAIGRDELIFYVNKNRPTIHLVSPSQGNYTNSSQVNFTYVPSSNSSIGNCSLYGDFNGSYVLNQTDFIII